MMSSTTAPATSTALVATSTDSTHVLTRLQSRLDRLVEDVDTKLDLSDVFDSNVPADQVHDVQDTSAQELVAQVDDNGVPIVSSVALDDDDSSSDGEFGPDIMIIPFQTNSTVDKSYSIPFSFGTISTVKSFVSKIATTVHNFQQDDMRIIQYFMFKQLKYFTLPKDSFHLQRCALVFNSCEYVEQLWDDKLKVKPVTKKEKKHLATWFDDYRDTIHIIKCFKLCLEDFDRDGVIENHRATY
jgi:hypothetical protein